MYLLFPLSRSSNQIVEIEESDGEGEGEGPEVVELFQFGTSAELTQKAEAKASLAHTIHPHNLGFICYNDCRADSCQIRKF